MNFLKHYKLYLYAVLALILFYGAYVLLVEPRVRLSKANKELKRAEQNISVAHDNTQVTVVDELNRYDANQTQVIINDLKEEYEEINLTVDVVNDNDEHEWVFFTTH